MTALDDTAALLHVQERLDGALAASACAVGGRARAAGAADAAALLEERRAAVARLRGDGAGFWAAALAAHPGVGAAIDVRDAPHLRSLRHVGVVERAGCADSFGLAFEFAADAGLAAPVVIVKRFGVEQGRGEVRGRVDGGARVEWREGCGGGKFFAWLEGDEDAFGIGRVLRDYVIPRAVDLFIGTARLNEESEDSDDDEG